MLQYLSVARTNPNSKNGKQNTNLPYGLKNIFELSTSDIAIQDKLRILLEQAILAQTVVEMSDDTNTDIKQYLNDLYKISSICIPVEINTMDSVRYARYRSILFGLLSNELYSKYNAIELLNDRQNFSNESVMLPKEFYIPYLSVASKRTHNQKIEDYELPVLLIPHMKDGVTGKYIEFQSQCYAKCHLTDKITKFAALAPMMDYILRLDWSSKSWIQFTEVIQSYGLNTYKTLEAQKSVSGVLASILQNKNNNCMNCTKAKHTYVEYLRYVNDRYRIGIDSFESLYFVLSGLGYENLDFLISKNPTQRQVAGFEKYIELDFLKSHKLQAALEAAESSEPEDEEEESEQDDLEDDPETDPDAPDEEDFEDTDSDSDTGEMDESLDDDMETTDDSMGEDSSGGAGATSTDTIEEPNDPFSVVFNITKSESLNEYFQREAICNALTSIVKNPPKEMSGETVAFLKVWLTQWVNLVSIDTTKTVLQQLSVSIDL